MPRHVLHRFVRGLLPALILVILTGSGCDMLGFATPEPITIRFAYRGESPEIKALLDRYMEAHPQITIESHVIRPNSGDVRTFVATASIDVFRESRDVLSSLDSGFVRPLDSAQLADFAEIRDDYYQGAWEALSVRGQQWGIPAGLDMLVTYVNATQAEALGVPLPDATWDLFDFIELASALNYPEGLPTGSGQLFGFCSDIQSFDPVVFVYMHGGGIVDDIVAPTRATLDSTATIEAVQWYSDLFNRLGVAPKRAALQAAFTRGGVYEAQIRGACGIWLGWFSDRGGRRFDIPWTVDWQMLPLPRDVEQGAFGEVDGYYITANSTHPDEVLEFVRFLADNWEASGVQLPPRISLAGSVPYARFVGNEVAAVATEVPARLYIVPADMSQALEQVGGAFFVAVQQIVNDDLDAAQVLQEVQDRFRYLATP